MSTHRYAVRSTWTGNTGSGTTGYRDYRRDVTVSVSGKHDLLASADRARTCCSRRSASATC